MNNKIFLVKKEPPDSGFLAFENIEAINQYFGRLPEYIELPVIKQAKQSTIMAGLQIDKINNALDACIKVKIKNMQLIYALSEAYPFISIADCIRQMDAWALANSKKYRYYDKTLTTWVENTYKRGSYASKSNGRSTNINREQSNAFKITNG